MLPIFDTVRRTTGLLYSAVALWPPALSTPTYPTPLAPTQADGKNSVRDGSYLLLRIITTIAALLCLSPLTWAQYTEGEEPNQLCTQAQQVGLVDAFPADLLGELALIESDPPGDVDFFRFESIAGTRLRVQLSGSPSGSGTLEDPYLGLFDSQCVLVAASDDYQSLESRLDFVVPPDGTFILAATGCCDGSFEGYHGYQGTYLIAISEPTVPIDAITGRVVDVMTGEPLPGNVPPYSMAELRSCDNFGNCYYYLNSQYSDEFGAFDFETDWLGNPLDPGDYVVAVYAGDYQPAEIGPFHVASTERYDLGDVPLQPPPFVFTNIVPCADIPAGGGTCKYSVDLRNNTTQAVIGLGWSLVNTWGGTSQLGTSSFQADRVNRVRVPALSSRTLKFSFDVPEGVADGTLMCADGWFSDRETQFFGTLRQAALFCVSKQNGVMQLLAPKAAAALHGVDKLAPGNRKLPGKPR